MQVYPRKERMNRAVEIMLLVLGLVSLLGSAAYNSYVAAFIRLGLTLPSTKRGREIRKNK